MLYGYISQETFHFHLEHSLGLLLVGLDAMSLALVQVLALSVDEHLLVLALAFGLANYVPRIEEQCF
jgi:hypothetical protein